MELRQYWRVLVRRRAVLLYTFLLVAVLGLINVAYSYYTSRYLGNAQIGIQVQPDYRIKSPVTDPQIAAGQLSDQVISEMDGYAGSIKYFKLVQAELKRTYHINIGDWRTLATSLQIFRSSSGQHTIYVQSPGTDPTKATHMVAAAADQLMAWAPYYRAVLNPQMPRIDTKYIDPPGYKRQGLTKPLEAFLLRAALGIVAGIVLAYLFEYLDDSVQDAGDVEHWMHLPTLAVIPGGRQARRARSA